MAMMQAPMQASQSAVVLPMSARERKQVYNHSAIFDGGGPTSIYNAAQQTKVLQHVHQVKAVRFTPRQVVMLSPADCRATANAGSGVVIPAARGQAPVAWAAPAVLASPRLGQVPDPVQVVHAARDSGAIPREFRATGTNLQWSDMRSETMQCRGQDFHQGRNAMDASQRKRQDMSSEVFGSTRRVEVSTSRPSKEIRAVEFDNCNNTDTSRDRFHTQQPRQPAAQPAEAAEMQSPRVDRTRQAHNLGASKESHQFVVYEKPAPADDGRKERAALAETRRRKERNYSDIHSRSDAPAPLSARGGGRFEVHSTATCSFLNPTVEIATRSRRNTVAGQQAGEVVWQPEMTPRTQRSPEKAEEQQLLATERICFETGGMEMAAEVTRRHRERLSQRGATGTPRGDTLSSATDRKRDEFFSSGSVRAGMGNQTPREERRGKEDLREVRRSMTAESPLMRSFRGSVVPDTPRSRQMANLQSSIF